VRRYTTSTYAYFSETECALLKLAHLSHLSRKERHMYGKIYNYVLQESGICPENYTVVITKYYHVNINFNKKFWEELIA
jgi:hypothetical protein